MRMPAIAKVRAELLGQWCAMRCYPESDYLDGEGDVAGADVRLQVWPNGGWELHTGDAQYDQDHRGAWGCGFLPYRRSNLTELARELIAEAREAV